MGAEAWLETVPLVVRAGRMAGVAVAATVVAGLPAVVVVAVLFCCCRIIKLGFVVGFEFPATAEMGAGVVVVDDETTSRVCALMMILCVCPAAAITCPCDTAIS